MRRCEASECETELTGRSDSRFCSSACRQRAYRDRERIFAEYGTRDWDEVLRLATERVPWSVTASSRNAERQG